MATKVSKSQQAFGTMEQGLSQFLSAKAAYVITHHNVAGMTCVVRTRL